MAGWFSNPLEAVVGLATGGLSEASGRPPPAIKPAAAGTLLSGLPGIRPPPTDDETFKKPDVGPPLQLVDPEGKTAANVGDTKNFTVPSTVPTTFDTTPPGTDMSGRAGPPRTYRGPVTPELAVAAGFSKEEAADWANLANWITKGESRRDEGAFTELFNGDHWLGGDKNHPYQLGWAGDTYNGAPTTAYGLFQDLDGTWKEISQKYLGGDTRTTPVNQVKGNLLYAAAEYSRRTGGRNLLADFKAGQLTSVEANLHSIWPTLGQKYGGGGAARAGDAAFNRMIQLQEQDIAAGEAGLKEILALAQKADPLSAELKKHLVTALERSDKLAERYQQLAEKPPVSQTPMEAAGAFAPFLTMLAMLGGLATRRPALGAISALSGALQGLNEGNDKQYKNNVDLWKTQTDMAMTTFDMQNKSIRNIMDAVDITDREKQHQLTDAFRFWQMDQDLRLARENQWAEIYKRQDQREDRELQRRLLLERTETALRARRREEEDERMGAADMTGEAYVRYVDLWKKRKAELTAQGIDRDPDASEIVEMHDKAYGLSRTRRGQELTIPQRRKNAEIEQARKELDWDHFPKSFDEDLSTAITTRQRLTDDQLKEKGYNVNQRALYQAEVDASLNPDKMGDAEKLAVKRYNTARDQLFEVPRIDIGPQPQEQQRTPGQVEDKRKLDAMVLDSMHGGENREATKKLYLYYGAPLGLSDSDFDALWPPPVETPTGAVAPPTRLGLEPQFGM